MSVRRLLVGVAILSLAVTCGPFGCGTTSGGNIQRVERKEGPLVPKELTPKSQDDIEWFLIGQYLFRGDYDPELTKWVFTAFHAPIPYLRFEPGTADLLPARTTPFAVGLRDGRVVLACWERLMSHPIGQEMFSRARRHIPLGLTDAEQEGAVGLTPSEDMRLCHGSWRLIAIGVKSRRPSESWNSWSVAVPVNWRSRIATALSSARRIYFSLDPYSSSEGRSVAPTGYASAEQPPWRVEFDKPVPVEVIPVDEWDPYYYLEGREGMHRDDLREPQPKAAPGRMQALAVKLERRYVDQVVILPDGKYQDTAEVHVRLSALRSGSTPASYRQSTRSTEASWARTAHIPHWESSEVAAPARSLGWRRADGRCRRAGA